MTPINHSIRASDGSQLAAFCFPAVQKDAKRCVIINSAMATPRHFYRHFATALTEAGYTAITWDYRGIGDSAPQDLRGHSATMRDWGLIDIPAVIDWARSQFKPEKLFLIGHSAGGQLAGLTPHPEQVDGMVTVSSQSPYWRMQSGFQKFSVLFNLWVTLPALTHLFGYFPWGRLFGGTDVPKGIALEWGRWSRNPKYVLGDDTLPLERYARFEAPVLAYSIDDDHWGTARAVDFMMSAYPNCERRHLVPADYDLQSIGHIGYFRNRNASLWTETIDWLDQISDRE